jgi:hypothetical protein
MAAVAEIRHKGEPVAQLLICLQASIGFIILCVAGVRISREYSLIRNSDIVAELLLPPVLSLLFVPAMYMIVLYARYE